ncbi:hypothetical protein BGZ76_003993 [Entomortierella beljakovae]|nr:hypothetical protein BGZ76_003993 [Entomortierella beljakovae]
MIAILMFGFIVEAWPRGNTKVQRSSRLPVYEKANLFSQVTFYFYQPIISLSVKRPLTMSDIANLVPKPLLTNECSPKLESLWVRAIRNAKWENKSPGKNSGPSLFKTILRFHLLRVPALVTIRLSRVFANYMQPALLSLLLKYFQDIQKESVNSNSDTSPRTNTSLQYGLFLVGAMFIAGVSNAILLVTSRQYCLMKGLETRTALIAMIYRKALRLSPDARQKSTTGSIMNHMSVDADFWGEGLIFLTMWISMPTEIILGLLQCWSAWIGMLVMVAMSPLQGWRARIFGKMQREKWSHMDERIRLTTESLAAIKVVKLYAWEHPFLQKILAVRNRELDVIRRMGVVQAIMSIVNSSSTIVISLATLSVFATWGGPGFSPGNLTPQVVFVSMTLFAMLKTPISSLTEATTSTVGLIVATKRIETFLLSEELDSKAIVRETKVLNTNSDEPLVSIKNGTFSWTKSKTEDDYADETQGLLSAYEGETDYKATLQNICLSIQSHDLVAIVGRVGQGKSSLLSAIIGEMYKLNGYVKITGQIAYVPQQAWIMNATLRDNILFGKVFDSDRYNQIIYACGLLPDIEMLPAGDATEIGERGINLSGGQKQRVSLARAAYADADIYLLDDPLSAVDAHVDHLLWTNLIGPQGLLKEKTRLLVTHGINHLHEVDQIVVLKDGQVIENGSYDELLGTQKIFYQLIKEFSITHKIQESESEEPSSAIIVPNGGISTPENKVGGAINLGPQKDTEGAKALKKSDGKLTTAEKIDVGELRRGVALAYLSAAYVSANLEYKFIFIIALLTNVLFILILVPISMWLLSLDSMFLHKHA